MKTVAAVVAPVATMAIATIGPASPAGAADRVTYSETHEFTGLTDTDPAYSFTCDIQVMLDWDTASGRASVWTTSRGDPECTHTSNVAVVEVSYVDRYGHRRDLSATGRGGSASLGVDEVADELETTHWVKYSHANTTSPIYHLPPESK